MRFGPPIKIAYDDDYWLIYKYEEIVRYSIQSIEWEYVKIYGFLSLARKFNDKYGKRLVDTKTRTDAEKIASKNFIQKQLKWLVIW